MECVNKQRERRGNHLFEVEEERRQCAHEQGALPPQGLSFGYIVALRQNGVQHREDRIFAHHRCPEKLSEKFQEGSGKGRAA
jgi:hypothetical protein